MSLDTEVGAKIRVMRRYNIGNYSHIELEMEIAGEYEKLKANPEMAKGLVAATTNMGQEMDDILIALLKAYNAKMTPPGA
jgi:hypothetical protein